MTDLSSYGVYFNSGQNNRSNKYITGDNVTHIQINASDQTYYQDGIIELFDCSTQNVGDNVDIYLNDSLEFSGYVARRQIHHKAGKKLYSYQLVGKTYDLWRYRTGSNTTYTGYTGYIASSLVHDFCTNIYGNLNIDEGTNIENKIDFSDQTVGDALVTLTNYDAFKFYIDNNNNLVYYNPDDEESDYIIIVEDDIIDMSPIEEADEDLINDALVIGANNYYATTEIPLPAGKAIANVSSGTFKRNMLLSQRVKVKEDTLSAVRMFLGRSTEPYQPQNNVEFEVWDNSTRTIINDDFNGGMDNWNTLENTEMKDGFLQLEGATYIQQPNYTYSHYGYYHAQTFTPTETKYIDSAYMSLYNSWYSNSTLWIDIRKTLSDKPSGALLCSGSISFGTGIVLSTYINLNPKVSLVADTRYALVAHLEQNNSKKMFRIDKNDGNSYTNGNILESGTAVDSGWGYWGSGNYDAKFFIKLSGYQKSGFALSKSFGSPSRKMFDRYMKVELDGVTSSQRVYISGSNSGSKNWKTLTDGQWYDFGFENKFSSQVKIWLSGNGTYTPKVGSVIAYIADEDSGPQQTLFTDNFVDYTYLDSATKNKVTLDYLNATNMYMIMSGSKGWDYETMLVRPLSYSDTLNKWGAVDGICDTSDDTASYNTDTSTFNLALVFTLTKYLDISRLDFLTKDNQTGVNYIHLHSIYLSGNWAGRGFIKAWEGTTDLIPIDDTNNEVQQKFANYCTYYDVKKVAVSGHVYGGLYENTIGIRALKILTRNNTTFSGTIQTTDFNVGVPVYSLKLTPYETGYTNYCTYSGTKNTGSTWYKLTPSTWTKLGDGGASGSHVKFMYNLKPYNTAMTQQISSSIGALGSILKNQYPYINYAVGEYSTTISGDFPKSGTKLFNSDEIYLAHTDVAYPPSYSAWANYTYPSLRDSDGTILDTDNYYWIVMKAYSGATTANEYWKYYYDPKSTYTDGLIACSTGGTIGEGVSWKPWTNSGSLIMDIGWKGDAQIRATAINEQSINLYGRHQKIVNDSSIDSFVLASSMANKMVENMDVIPQKGNVVIDGRPGIKTTYRLSSNLEELGLGGFWEIVSYSQIVDGQGFRTQINYGKSPYDPIKEINTIKREMGL